MENLIPEQKAEKIIYFWPLRTNNDGVIECGYEHCGYDFMCDDREVALGGFLKMVIRHAENVHKKAFA